MPLEEINTESDKTEILIIGDLLMVGLNLSVLLIMTKLSPDKEIIYSQMLIPLSNSLNSKKFRKKPL
jgi:hypothetical protein